MTSTIRPLEIKHTEFSGVIAEFRDLQTFRPELPSSGDWHYFGPAAVRGEYGDKQGIIVKANDPSALADVLDWEPVQRPIEPQPFTTWRGVAPEGYVVVGHFFTTGFLQKPNPEQTAGIKAVRKDLVSELGVQRLIWSGRLPFDIVTLWDVVAIPRLFIPTGAFVSKHGDSAGDLNINVLYFNA